jgi:hypothetical protein
LLFSDHLVFSPHSETIMATKQKNQGEGDKESARKYNEATEKFAKSGKVDEAARQARRDVEGPKGAELADAERAGKSRAKGEDPQLNKKGR